MTAQTFSVPPAEDIDDRDVPPAAAPGLVLTPEQTARLFVAAMALMPGKDSEVALAAQTRALLRWVIDGSVAP